MDRRLNVHISDELHKEIKRMIIDKEMNISEYVRMAVVEKLARDKGRISEDAKRE